MDTVAANATLTNTSLAVTGLPTLTLSGFTTANLTDTAGGNTFTVSGWTGAGSLTDSAATGDTVTASKSAGFTLTNTSLSSTDGMTLGLSGITTANLTDTGSRHTFTVTGWTGSGTLKGSTETLVDSVSSSVVLANTSLAVTGLPTLTLSGFTTANLTDTAGGNTFTVSGWTGSGSLTDSAAAARHGDGEQERRLHPDQHLAVLDRRHGAWPERHHDRQPRCHQLPARRSRSAVGPGAGR